MNRRKIDDQIDELLVDFNKFELSMDALLEDIVASSAKALRKKAIKNINTQTTGKGKAPNTDTGDLVGSVEIIHRQEEGNKVAYVGSDLHYAGLLETVRNRPWLRPAAKWVKKTLRGRTKSRLNVALRKARKNA